MKFPPLCIHCAAGASQQVRIRKVFTFKDEESGEESCQVEVIHVPVCAGCADRHRAEYRPVPFLTRLLPALKSWSTVMFLGPFLTGLFFLSEALQGKFILLAVVALFWSIAGILWLQIVNRSQQYGIPPDTVVTSSVTFSSRMKKLFEPERRRFEFRNDAFGNAFLELNRAKLWDPRSPEAIAAKSNRAILQYIAIALGVVLVVWLLIRDFMSE